MERPEFFKKASDAEKIHDDKKVSVLQEYGADVSTDRFDELAYRIKFHFDAGAVTTIRLLLHDQQSGADVTITHMTTLPDEKKRTGYGSQAIQHVLTWAKQCGYASVCATQVSSVENINFWEKNGFIRKVEPNPTGDYVYLVPE